ncbi:hypothetical protein BDV98DRAFT_587997 [Pterulicium gracile]|uniref:Uncharacterized protein n=1 Tax=Pterulicium gracile TaxID=1884261 RepID=A0A5C3R1I2_9AGAR|nr:hypothetical protein BDV98DRAFT_587997 [Pterula gracilis]
MQSFPWIRFTVFAGGLIGCGYMLMRATVPTPEQTYAAAGVDPDQAKPVWASK